MVARQTRDHRAGGRRIEARAAPSTRRSDEDSTHGGRCRVSRRAVPAGGQSVVAGLLVMSEHEDLVPPIDPLRSHLPMIVYLDFKSPYAYLAKAPTYALEEEFGIEIDWRALTLDIPSYLGSARLGSD